MTEPRKQPDLTDVAAGTGASVLLTLMRSKLKFVAAIGIIFVAGLIFMEGFTPTTIVVGAIALFMIGLFGALVWFWTSVLASFNPEKKP